MRNFEYHACIDWSGAKGAYLNGLALAIIGPHGPPELIQQDKGWSRQALLEWILRQSADNADIMIGLDLSFAFPFADHGAYFPQWNNSPLDARALWAAIEEICADDPHLSAHSFLQHHETRRHFRHAKGDVGDLFEGGIGRLRAVEMHQRVTKQANSWSCFNLVGAGQVGKSSLTGMRMLHRLGGQIPIWPFDPIPKSGPLIIEIYTSMAARAAGLPPGRSKIRDYDALRAALAALNSPCPEPIFAMNDHNSDALLTAAWLREANSNPRFWQPKLLNDEIRATEGWTFGVF